MTNITAIRVVLQYPFETSVAHSSLHLAPGILSHAKICLSLKIREFSHYFKKCYPSSHNGKHRKLLALKLPIWKK